MSDPTAKRQRTCVGCGAKSDKMQLYRIVRSSSGSVSVDLSGKAAGRGAYICSARCFEKALKEKRLQRSLKTNISESDAARIADDLRTAFTQTQTR